MISRLRGILLESEFTSCVIEVGGVGYEVAIALSTFDKLPRPGEEVTMYIHTHVREDAIVLFGFATIEERKLFRALTGVSGVGGKMALNILSAMPVSNFSLAVESGDIKSLSQISGIGKRTAERLVVELKGKLDPAAALVSLPLADGNAAADAMLALEQLGFKRENVAKTINQLISELPKNEVTTEKLVRAALLKLNF